MTHSREIAFIDPAITDFETLLAGLRPDVEAVVLSPDEPAVTQMARSLEERTNLDAIHVIAHGRPGEVNFAAGPISYETIKDETIELPGFGRALGTEKALLIWACETGAGKRGVASSKRLRQGQALASRLRAALSARNSGVVPGRWTAVSVPVVRRSRQKA